MDEKFVFVVCFYCGVGCRLYIRSFDGYFFGIEYVNDIFGILNENGKFCFKGNVVFEYVFVWDRFKKLLKVKE